MLDRERLNFANDLSRAEAIAQLNDELRQTARGGRILVTRGVGTLPGFDAATLLKSLADYADFDIDNDPHGERDFGDLSFMGQTLLWKVDYYDRQLRFGSDDPADEAITVRVLTIMLRTSTDMQASLRRRVELTAWARETAFCPDLAPPEDWPATAALDSAGCMPLWQGSYLPCLSGVFAAVNAVRLIATQDQRLIRREEEELLATALRWQQDRGYSALSRGLRKSDWPRLLDALCERFRRLRETHLKTAQPWRLLQPDREAFLTGIERLVVSQNVVAVLLAGANYSVVRGYTPLSILLFDSGGRRWISRAAICLPGEVKRSRHHMVPAATLTLGRAW